MSDKRPRLLVVEDEDGVRELIQDTLKVLTIEIFTAVDGRAALEILKTQTPDAILSDIKMPKLDGIGLLKSIRASGSDIPFIILTGYGDKTSTLEALRLGAFDFIEKPFDLNNLRESVFRAVEVGRKRRELESQYSDTQTKTFISAKKAIELMKFVKDEGKKKAS